MNQAEPTPLVYSVTKAYDVETPNIITAKVVELINDCGILERRHCKCIKSNSNTSCRASLMEFRDIICLLIE